MQSILLIGDSITQQGYVSSWVSRLSNHYIRRVDVINRGLSGYNSRMLLNMLKDPKTKPLVVPPHAVGSLFVTLMIGSNDMATNEQAVPLEEYRRNLKELLHMIYQEVKPVCGIFVLSVPPLDDAGRLLTRNCTARTFERAKVYCAAGKEVVQLEKDGGLEVYQVDLYRAMMQFCDPNVAEDASYDPSAPWNSLFVDGLHPNELGGAVMFHALMNTIRQSPRADQLNAENIPFALPTWQELV